MQLSLIVGRILTRTGPEGVTTFEYYVAGSCSNNSPVKITGFNGVIKEYTYDTYKRPATEKVTIDGVAFTTSFTYNNYNALTKIVYPSGVEENRVYDVTGGLLTVTGGNAGSPVTLFTASDINGFGQYTGYTLGNGKTAQHTYHYGTPTRYYTAGVQDLNFTWDYTKGNLLTRQDAIKIITEDFTFDNLNRLTTSTVNGTQQFSITYDGDASSSMGNIITKTDAGNYVYKTDKIHAVAYITNPAGAQTPPANISTIEQQITYTPFLKAATVTEAPYRLEFTYGPDYERVKTILKNNSVLQETRLFLGSYEKQIIAGGATREIHYIGGGNGMCAILVKEAGVVTPYYVYTDHLGSILTITNTAGTIIAEQNFDAWGRKRNPANWQYANVPATPTWLFRGYTGHEHVPEFSLINMNGRIYDPVQGRMLSPDNYVPLPFNTQGYNRYSYANNNPLSYIDPDGNFIFSALLPGIGTFIDAALWGGAIGGASYTAGLAINGNLSQWSFSGLSRSMLVGAGSGLISAGIGSMFGSGGGFGHELMRGLTHGVGQGIFSGMTGGSFGPSLFSGSFSSLTGSMLSNQPGSTQMNAGLLSGAIASKLGGGSFFEGAVIGGLTIGLNHLMPHYITATAEGKFFTDQTEAYNYMWKNSFVSDDVVENGAFITGGGVLVLPNDQNGPTTAEFARLPIRTSDRGRWTHVKFEGKWHSIKGSVHTHPQAGITPDKWGMRFFSPEDRSLFRNRMPSYNHYVMSKVETFVYFPRSNTYQQLGNTSDVLSGKIKFYR